MNPRNPSVLIHLPGLIGTDPYTDTASATDLSIDEGHQRVLEQNVLGEEGLDFARRSAGLGYGIRDILRPLSTPREKNPLGRAFHRIQFDMGLG